MVNFEFSLPALLALALFASGCSDDCVSACESGKECKDATDAQKKMDCDKTCDDLDDLGEASNCTDRIDEYTSCASDDDDAACSEKCEEKFTAAYTCMLSYCSAHDSDPKCAAVAADFGFSF